MNCTKILGVTKNILHGTQLRNLNNRTVSIKWLGNKSDYSTKWDFNLHSLRSMSSTRPLHNNLLQLGKLNHVAIATSDLKNSTSVYRDILGAKVSGEQDLPAHGVTTVFVNLGNTKIELLQPLGENSPIKNFLEKNPSGGIHHICIEVEDIEIACESLRASGKIRILDPKPKIGAHGKPVVFLHPKDCGGVLVELEEA